MSAHEQFARNLRRARTSREMSQEDLAHTAGFHPTEISRLERAVREPRLSTIVRLARALEMAPATLLENVR